MKHLAVVEVVVEVEAAVVVVVAEAAVDVAMQLIELPMNKPHQLTIHQTTKMQTLKPRPLACRHQQVDLLATATIGTQTPFSIWIRTTVATTELWRDILRRMRVAIKIIPPLPLTRQHLLLVHQLVMCLQRSPRQLNLP
jgi:hypothetical protein